MASFKQLLEIFVEEEFGPRTADGKEREALDILTNHLEGEQPEISKEDKLRSYLRASKELLDQIAQEKGVNWKDISVISAIDDWLE